MITSIVICAVTCVLMILSILLLPQIKIGKLKLDTYCVVALAGACAMLIAGCAKPKEILSAFTADNAVNPLKILTLFISMTVLSVFLDEVGFFGYIAAFALKKAGRSRKRLFFYLYITVSVLTVFTSNDIIILTFTPFICYFAKSAKIDPVPYLFAEFIAANTWSMALIIGNPTNIYISSAMGIDFVSYLKVMILPTVAAGLVALGILWLCFGKSLSKPIEVSPDEGEEAKIKNKPLLIIGLVLLSVCTLIMAVGSYFDIEMWIVSFSSAVLLFILVLIASAVQKHKPTELGGCLRRAPWQLIPFVLSMFVIVSALDDSGATALLGKLLGEKNVVFSYGLSSALAANMINNIPMSVLYVPVLGTLPVSIATPAAFGAIVGSNIGAFITPVGALAEIMWMSLLKRYDVSFSFGKFMRYGAVTAIPTILAALAVISLII